MDDREQPKPGITVSQTCPLVGGEVRTTVRIVAPVTKAVVDEHWPKVRDGYVRKSQIMCVNRDGTVLDVSLVDGPAVFGSGDQPPDDPVIVGG